MKQVNVNSYPLYRFSGEARAGNTNGEGLGSFGGTCYVFKAAADSATTSAVKSFGSPAPVAAGY